MVPVMVASGVSSVSEVIVCMPCSVSSWVIAPVAHSPMSWAVTLYARFRGVRGASENVGGMLMPFTYVRASKMVLPKMFSLVNGVIETVYGSGVSFSGCEDRCLTVVYPYFWGIV